MQCISAISDTVFAVHVVLSFHFPYTFVQYTEIPITITVYASEYMLDSYIFIPSFITTLSSILSADIQDEILLLLLQE